MGTNGAILSAVIFKTITNAIFLANSISRAVVQTLCFNEKHNLVNFNFAKQKKIPKKLQKQISTKMKIKNK